MNKPSVTYDKVYNKIIKSACRHNTVTASDFKNTTTLLNLIDNFVKRFKQHNQYKIITQFIVINLVAAELAVRILGCPAQPINEITKRATERVSAILKGIEIK